jgi:hypothetical protein
MGFDPRTLVSIQSPIQQARHSPILMTRQRRIVASWLALGLVDWLVAIPLARVCRVEDPASMTALGYPPLSLISTYFVPLAFIDYVMLGARIWGFPRGAPRCRVAEAE